MKVFSIFFAVLIFSASLLGSGNQKWMQVRFDQNNQVLKALTKEGIIEIEESVNNTGWMTEKNYYYYKEFFNLQLLDAEIRPILPPQISQKDSVGQVIAVYPLPPAVESVRGLTYHGGYFYLVDAKYNSEKIHRLDPNDNFSSVKTFPTPSNGGSVLPWGAASDGRHLYIADALQDKIFEIDTSGNISFQTPAQGPICSGLGYRTNQLWNADLGDATAGIPKRMYVSDTLGVLKASYLLNYTINGVAGSQDAVYFARNKTNGKDVWMVDPGSFVQRDVFVSPLDYPNGLAFDGTYLWICGLNSGVGYIMQVYVGIDPPPPYPPVNFFNVEFLADQKYNSGFVTQFDANGNIHGVFSSKTDSSSKIIYTTNRNGYWELKIISGQVSQNDNPAIQIDQSGTVHVVWQGFSDQDNDLELYYCKIGTDDLSRPFKMTSKLNDGIVNHVFPDFQIGDNGHLMLTFRDEPASLNSDIYFAEFDEDTIVLIETVHSSIENDHFPQIILKSGNVPYVFWHNQNQGFWYADKNSGSWQASQITAQQIGVFSVAADADEKIHFVITNEDTVKYGNDEGGFSVKQVIARHAGNCARPDIAFDDEGILHLAYQAGGDSVNSWPDKMAIFYSDQNRWEAGVFPQDISLLPSDLAVNAGIAATDSAKIFVGWSAQLYDAFSEGYISDLYSSTTLIDNGGTITPKISLADSSLDFGYVAGTDTSEIWLRISNEGSRELQISELQIVNDQEPPFVLYSTQLFPVILNPLEQTDVPLYLFVDVPVETDTIFLDAEINFVSNDLIEPVKTVTVTGTTVPVSSIEPRPLIREFKLYKNYPNPFNPSTTFKFDLPRSGNVLLQVFDISGRKIKTVLNSTQKSGQRSVTWNGTNENGTMVASGIYFYVLQYESYKISGKMLLMK